MISQLVLKLGRRCTRLAGFARGAGRQVAAAGSELFRLPLGRQFVDLYEFQVGLGEVLELLHAELVELDERLTGAVQRGRELRQARRCLTAELRSTLSEMRHTLYGFFDPAELRRLLLSVDRLPEDPAALVRLAGRLFAHLTDPDLELPPEQPAVVIDPPVMAQGFEAPMRQLGATLAELAEVEAAEKQSRAKKAEACERLKGFAGRVERFYRALYEVTGNWQLADRLRKGARGS